MNKSFLTAILIGIVALLAIVFSLINADFLPDNNIIYVAVVLFGLLSWVVGNWIAGALKERPAVFVNRYMMGFGIKMFTFLIFVGAYLYQNPPGKIKSGIALFLIYMIFNVIMITNIRQQEKKAKM